VQIFSPGKAIFARISVIFKQKLTMYGEKYAIYAVHFSMNKGSKERVKTNENY